MFDHVYLEYLLEYKYFLLKHKDSSRWFSLSQYFFWIDNLKCILLHTKTNILMLQFYLRCATIS